MKIPILITIFGFILIAKYSYANYYDFFFSEKYDTVNIDKDSLKKGCKVVKVGRRITSRNFLAQSAMDDKITTDLQNYREYYGLKGLTIIAQSIERESKQLADFVRKKGYNALVKHEIKLTNGIYSNGKFIGTDDFANYTIEFSTTPVKIECDKI